MKQVVPVIFCMALSMTFVTNTALINERIRNFDDKKIGSLSVGIDGGLIHDMLWVIDTIESIKHGSRRHNTERTSKKYQYRGDWYSLNELEALEHGNTEEKEEEEEEVMLETLAEVKEDFNDIITHFMQQLIVKNVICNAVKEWCEKSHRPKSMLKRWAKSSREEFKDVYLGIKTARSLNEFLTDLEDFFVEVIASCPRAWEEFLEHQEEYAARTISINNDK
jgi:hypothetical protein